MKPEPRTCRSTKTASTALRHLAEKWQADGTLKKIKAFLLADMIGDADLNIERDSNSTPWLEDVVYEAATRLGYQSHFFARDHAGERRSHSLRASAAYPPPISSTSTTATTTSSGTRRKIPSTSSAPRAWKSSAAPCSRQSAFSTKWIRSHRSKTEAKTLVLKRSHAFRTSAHSALKPFALFRKFHF